MQRITDRDLDNICAYLNKITGNPINAYDNSSGKLKANIGCYHIHHAYQGVSLHQMHNEHGAISEPLPCGIYTKRELYRMIQSFIAGIEQGVKV